MPAFRGLNVTDWVATKLPALVTERVILTQQAYAAALARATVTVDGTSGALIVVPAAEDVDTLPQLRDTIDVGVALLDAFCVVDPDDHGP